MAICRARASLSLLKTKSPFFQYVPLHGFSSSQFSSQFESVGFIGLGNMGSRMANNLIKNGYKVAVHDINCNVMEMFSDMGVPTKETPFEVAEASDVVITMLPSSSHRKEFAKEAKKFANIRHPNVVGLRGYYWGPTQHEKLILSDYISPGSLASFLYDRPGRKGPPLTWVQRLKIAVDVARGLNYLHFDRAVPHGNLKATNILLDGPDLNARVADYCLHRLMTQSGTIEQLLDAGVLGYRAPELAASKKPLPSLKSDVYAFGMIMLELLTGRCAGDVISGEGGSVDLTDWVRLRAMDCFDPALVPEMVNPAVDKGMKEVLGIALRCIRSVSDRPGIKTIYEDLSSI